MGQGGLAGERVSYDVYLEVDLGGPEPSYIEHDRLNYTYNVSPMFREALGGNGLKDLAGLDAGVAAQRLAHAIAQMAYPGNREKFEAMNPENGWGSHQGATEFLERMRAVCEAHPKAKVVIA